MRDLTPAQRAAIIQFEDTKLIDSPATRYAFDMACIETNMALMMGVPVDDGLNEASLSLRIKAGEILQETVPGATPELIAGAVMFLTGFFIDLAMPQFQTGTPQPSEYPQLDVWAKEWKEIQRGRDFRSVSLELRQIVAAVNCALLEGMKKNAAIMDPWELKDDLAEKKAMARDMGDIQTPALQARFDQLVKEVEQLGAQRDSSTTRSYGHRSDKPGFF